MEYKGYPSTVKREVIETSSTYFVCSRYRAGCRARLIVRDSVVKARNSHSCDEEEEAATIPDVCSRMRSELQKVALANLSLPPSLAWEQVMASLHKAHPKVTLRTIARLPASLSLTTSSDAFRAIVSTPTRNVAETYPRPFLQFSAVYTIGCELYRYVGFGHPELIRLLRCTNFPIYIDGTFKMVSASFRQCLIVMVKDLGVDVYVPAMYVLMDSKHQDASWNALNFVIIQTGRLLGPATLTCDFEKLLKNAVTEQFPLKQALRRKMIEVRIPQDQIAAALSPGMVDVLTIIPVAEIAGKIVRSRITQTGSKTKWNAFWRNFLSTWMQTYGANLWNVNSTIETGIDLHNRTTNPLESYNRVFSDKFTVKNPSLVAFVEITMEEAHRFVRLIDDVKNHRHKPPPHAADVLTGVVTIANGKKILVAGARSVRLKGIDGKSIRMVEVLHIPGLNSRLLSVGKLADRGMSVEF
ncbi:hypothetical protein PHMEG_0005060 [Phytophthora megakarya]|uniref:Retrovirus-related Pol polyprotein from transposon TNT 1-94-like beta-barrel domain-containing protein n=1 Tax=Phytophthora megakarya TaxID=4795 RepID=A0A225WS73_9STRA|nr:hypothetical protein PHMEG_0005060 [Phytophthora megakarya]